MNRKILLVLMLTMMLLTQASAQTTEQQDAVLTGGLSPCEHGLTAEEIERL